MKYKWTSQYTVIILIILCFASRLPQLLSENLFLDGDECIMGLMAKHFSEGSGVPYFFYGQSYGFSFIEVGIMSMFYWIFGISDISIKLSMLSLWTSGIVFFFKTLKEIDDKSNSWIPLLLTLIFIFSPAWAIWSMKARGGYLTAFLLSSIITYLICHKKLGKNLFVSFFIGLSVIVIYQSQALWLAGLIPILVYYTFRNKRMGNITSLILGLLLGVIVFSAIKSNLSTYWSPKLLSWPDSNFLNIPKRVYQNLTGSYNYSYFEDPMIITKFIAISFTIVIFTTVIYSFILFFKKKSINPLFYILACSVIFSIGYLFFIKSTDPRYLLPLSGFSLLMLFPLMVSVKNRKVINLLLGLFVLMGAYSLYDFKNYSFVRKAELISLIQELESKNIGHVYCEGALLQWKLMFYSKERIIARYMSSEDRYPSYIKQVDNALNEPKLKVGLVGYFDKRLISIDSNFIPIINTNFYIYNNPSETLLTERGFNLAKIDNTN